MKGTKVDRRIALFVLFSLPVILIAVISLVANSQSIYTGSKADEVKKEQTVTPTPSLPKQISCLVPRLSADRKTVTLYIEKGATFVPTLPLNIFAVQADQTQNLSLVEMIPTDNTKPLTALKTDYILGGSRIWFVALQGDMKGWNETGSEMDTRIKSIARSCESLILQP